MSKEMQALHHEKCKLDEKMNDMDKETSKQKQHHREVERAHQRRIQLRIDNIEKR